MVTPWNPMEPGMPPGYRTGSRVVDLPAEPPAVIREELAKLENGGTMVTPTTSLGETPPETAADFYGDGFNGEATALIDRQIFPEGAPTATLAAGAAPIAISMVWLTRSGLGFTANALRNLVGRGLQRWDTLPRWVQLALSGVGISWGSDLIFTDNGDDDLGVLPGPMAIVERGAQALGILDRDPTSKADQLEEFLGVRVASEWVANNVPFYRLVDGRLAVQNKFGVWKVWRPKKPIVIYASGSKDLRTLFRADRALQKASGKIAKMLRSRGYKVSRS